jgi:hypothetical protein
MLADCNKEDDDDVVVKTLESMESLGQILHKLGVVELI